MTLNAGRSRYELTQLSVIYYYKLIMNSQILSAGAYHLTFSCFKKRWLFNHPYLYEEFLLNMEKVRLRYDIKIYAFVLMPNHVHIIIASEKEINLSKLLIIIKRPFSYRALQFLKENDKSLYKPLANKTGKKTIYRFWQAGRGNIQSINSEAQLINNIDYIHNNPVRRGLTKSAEQWKWSSLIFWEKGKNNKLKLDVPDYMKNK